MYRRLDTHFPKLRVYCDKFAENVIRECPAYQITSHKSNDESEKDKLDVRLKLNTDREKEEKEMYTTFVGIFVGGCIHQQHSLTTAEKRNNIVRSYNQHENDLNIPVTTDNVMKTQ
ncbi:CLUMA_CG003228, isoform A [Clunio marinus]|uniref:CLUMA_CG003228, isoform A n=1 Tax=Clunio marinus TaxID=568069 RepID=A0A1J1HQ25_9DIPT|nr:CLUMA_CG003228, isoform A [Clunio marinus]